MEKLMAARDYVWKGAIPIQIHLHESEITTLPPPPPFLVLAPRVGYLPLLAPQIRPFFSAALPPGTDTVWFEYKGLPLKWYIPTGVLFDLLCAEPERPWNLTVHFRGYPANVLTPCEGEDAIKWSFITSLKEAACIIDGNCKSIMNMSQSDQLDLWRSILNGSLEVYRRVSSKLKLGAMEDEYITKLDPSLKITRIADDSESPAPSKTGRVPVRLYVRIVNEELDDIEDVSEINCWEEILYVNRPLDIRKGEGGCFSLGHVMKSLLPEYFGKAPEDGIEEIKQVEEHTHHPEDTSSVNNENEVGTTACDPSEPVFPTKSKEVKLIRIQGIEPKLEIPFSWVVNNLMNPDYFLHVCVYVKSL